MERYDVKILRAAQDDLSEIVDYLNTLSPQAAFRYYDMIVDGIMSLSEMPERCPLVRDARLRMRGYRFLVVESYMVFFVILDNIVQIRRILYGKRQYEDLL
jgi:plasmid stabilization system protein ParE